MSSAEGVAAQRVVFVLGPHRSGTSIVMGVLHRLGVHLGPPDHLLAGQPGDNEKGFNEHEALMRVSEAVLREAGGSWREPQPLPDGWEENVQLGYLREHARALIAEDFAQAPCWGLKDPRLSLTLPFWRRLVTPDAYVLCHRNPLDAARSLERRNAIPLAHGVALWAYYAASALLHTAGERRTVVGYDEVLANPEAVAVKLAALVSDEPPGRPADTASEIARWVAPDLRHHRSSVAELISHPHVAEPVADLFLLLRAAAQSPLLDDSPVSTRLHAVAESVVAAGPPAQERHVRYSATPPARVGPRRPRIVAMLQVYNERRFLAGCIEHLRAQGVEVYLIDNESTDETVAIAERYLGRGVIGIETLPRDDCFALRLQCARQEELALTLDADWLIHYDADEIRVSPKRGQTLAEAIAEVDEAGYNAINFIEFAFVPTREFPDHDHAGFQRTMRWYYPFVPSFPHRRNAWKRQHGPVDLASTAGHLVAFEGLRMAPESLYMRHYLFISVEHAIEKFVRRSFAPDEVADGWFGWRARLSEDAVALPSTRELRQFVSDSRLDPSEPRTRHLLDDALRRLAPAGSAP